MKRLRYLIGFFLLASTVFQIITWGRVHTCPSPEQIMEFDPLVNEVPTLIDWKFKNFNLSHWKVSQNIVLQSDDTKYYKPISSSTRECFIKGTDWTLTNNSKCFCIPGYFGGDCGIPSSVWHGHYKSNPGELKHLSRRQSPRRLIQGILFNHEFEMLDIRMATNNELVDAFIIQESNYTTIGEPKSRNLLRNLAQGWLSDYQEKILYLPLSSFPPEWQSDGWLVENSIRNHISSEGLPLVQNKDPDDYFLLFDADEVPNREALLFLKLYDGISEQVQFGLRWNLYGFFWVRAAPSEELLTINVGATLRLLEEVYDGKAIFIRSEGYEKSDFWKKVSKYKKNNPRCRLESFRIGEIGSYGGFHCSWCFKPEGIRTKLLSAQKEDKPRWGDYPEKTKLPYIASLIQTGTWFDGSSITIKATQDDSNFAPEYVLKHPDQFKHLISQK